ncbi:uncharacterized protein LACBIDRAFT_334800 [Laccaria bicolor S238N-H82]|uniref:Predicted protein n=1 Tax=Laccaria bicolor (strain S238N-H82 / ATCC MYA-4686) TaxID=486041 RepID=B0E0C7_LACBS|nr:uncharacterized protein LACBIDRAFT_334800 [Laccaria bicolor S238N-H82]EDQ99659.1 predicted protein [Laccaria bicolor S238N-H82]|eukprot:XP_001889636.1 predicted protein [Laccaria bicolor S238N-H82]
MKRGFLKTAKAKKTEGIALPPVALTPPSLCVAPKGDGFFAPRPVIKLPYGKVETSNVASLVDFVQPNIVTARPTEGVVSKKLFGREFPGDTLNYSDNTMVITTLPRVKSGATLDDEPDNWTECILAGPVKQRILSTPGFPQPVEKTAGEKVNHRVGPSPFGGLGVFATRPLRTGDLIVAERPLLISKRGIEMTRSKGLTQAEMIQVSMQEWEERLGVALKRMTDENRKAFMALANSHTEDGSGPILGIIRTNGYKVEGLYDDHENDDDRAYSAVLNVMSRINHSCSPNTTHHFDMASLSFHLRAIRDTEEGEELSSSYCNIFQTKSERAELLAPYGIVCACTGCVGATKETDLFRTEITKRFQKIQADHLVWTKDHSRPNPLAASLQLIEEMEKEGLRAAPLFFTLLAIVANVYSAVGHADDAIKYLEKLDDYCRASTGRSMEDNGLGEAAAILKELKSDSKCSKCLVCNPV